jgi:hypothetical protein
MLAPRNERTDQNTDNGFRAQGEKAGLEHTQLQFLILFFASKAFCWFPICSYRPFSARGNGCWISTSLRDGIRLNYRWLLLQKRKKRGQKSQLRAFSKLGF